MERENLEMKKTIFLIRHAQSEENVRISKAFDGWNRIKNLSLPSTSNVSAAFHLARLKTGLSLSY
jgi:hypothetical protein